MRVGGFLSTFWGMVPRRLAPNMNPPFLELRAGQMSGDQQVWGKRQRLLSQFPPFTTPVLFAFGQALHSVWHSLRSGKTPSSHSDCGCQPIEGTSFCVMLRGNRRSAIFEDLGMKSSPLAWPARAAASPTPRAA